MIKFSDIQKGDYLMANNDGDIKRGEVEDLNNNEKQVCVNTGAQGFWYETDQLSAIPLTEEELANLKFDKQLMENGNMKYMKGAFRLLLPKDGDFSRMELWYRDEQRHITEPIAVHTLQNHFYEMTKVHLNDEVFN